MASTEPISTAASGINTALYKPFPPGWDHIKIPTSSRTACKAGLALYAPCKPGGIWLQRAAWNLATVLGPWAIPGRTVSWNPPTDSATWASLLDRLQSEVGAFDEIAIYERPQVERQGLLLLLISEGSTVALAKLLFRDSGILQAEARALRDVCRFQPRTFSVPEPLNLGKLGDWSYLLLAPLPPQRHYPPKDPPLSLITQEIAAALASQPRPSDTPKVWLPMHGDLTPWNLRALPDRRLVLLDWESVSWGPPGADEIFYRAAVAALTGSHPAPIDNVEAVSFWKRNARDWPAGSGRDRFLGPRIQVMLDLLLPRTAGRPRPEARARPRVLVFAYACEPGRGSEPGTGWGLVQSLARFADCTVLVGPEHMPGIRRWQAENHEPALEFVEIAEPRVSAVAKWHRIPWFLLYLAWLRRAYRAATALHDKGAFDASYHATYAVYWLPTPAGRFNIPCVWGPVGGAARTPVRLWPGLGWKGVFGEVLDLVSVWIGNWLPTTRRTWRDVDSALLQNEETLARLPNRVRARSSILNHVLFVEPPEVASASRRSFILFPSALEARKGPRLAIEALAHTPNDVRLVFASDGPEEKALRRLASRLSVVDRIDFLGRVSRDRLFDLLAESAATLFTGLREEGGAALAEAMYCGCPVVVLANGGARTVAESATDPGRVRLVQPGAYRSTAKRLAAAMTEFSRNPSTAEGPTLDQNEARRLFRRSFEQVLWDGEPDIRVGVADLEQAG